MLNENNAMELAAVPAEVSDTVPFPQAPADGSDPRFRIRLQCARPTSGDRRTTCAGTSCRRAQTAGRTCFSPHGGIAGGHG